MAKSNVDSKLQGDPKLRELLRLIVEMQDGIPQCLLEESEVTCLIGRLTQRRIISIDDLLIEVEGRTK